MGERVVMPSEAQEAEDYNSLSISGHHNSTAYSSGAEGVPTDFSSSHNTPYGSPGQSWGLECGMVRDEVPGQGYWSREARPCPNHAYPEAYPSQRNETPPTRGRVRATTYRTSSSRNTSSPASTKSRKSRASKASKITAIDLEAPLSKLTKDLDVPVRDMESFVHRSTAQRKEETEKRKDGRIVRPMNAFILYRSAYTERAKQLFDQKNHQIVSKVMGQSWKMESEELRKYYKSLADIERQNHQKAWPSYKFSPSKPNSMRKRKSGDFSSDDEGTEQDPTDYDWTPPGSRRQRPTRQVNRRYGRDEDFESPFSNSSTYGSPSLHPEYYYMSPGRSVPVAMEENSVINAGQRYYQQDFHPYAHGPAGIEDAPQEGGFFALGIPSGFPDAAHQDLYEAGFLPEHGQPSYGYVDPKLEGFSHPQPNGMFTEDGFAEYHGEMLAERAQHLDHYPQLAPDQRSHSVFDMIANDNDGFQKWLEHENQQ